MKLPPLVFWLVAFSVCALFLVSGAAPILMNLEPNQLAQAQTVWTFSSGLIVGLFVSKKGDQSQ